jgi:hypothetical protein
VRYLVVDEQQQIIDSCQSENMALYSANEYRDRTGNRADIYTQTLTLFNDDMRGTF